MYVYDCKTGMFYLVVIYNGFVKVVDNGSYSVELSFSRVNNYTIRITRTGEGSYNIYFVILRTFL